jgi:glucose-6-phosphate isomerase
MMIEKYGAKEARERIYVTTGVKDSALKNVADREGYETFRVPDDIAGRFSVLTAVGLLPIAVAGIDIDQLLAGAVAARADMLESDINKNSANKYVAIRNILYNKQYTNEMFVGFEPALSKLAEWWKQLYGESEGKNHGGIIPQSATYTTDLHSLGQYLQEGRRDIFETVIDIRDPGKPIIINKDPDNLDGLNFVAGQNMDHINNAAMMGTIKAHVYSGVPNILIEMPDTSEYSVGYLLYFFEKACAVSGYLAGINPFDQPGVEAYKKNMYEILGKPQK